ncbi:c-type cytochrome [Bacterioplanoides pacificum]|uniref:C-type cytochrome n=1 Tax=Bacterioplanoides pacificum TaxID=1171596 RepID=A0ABV7VYW8_9GAMM
MKNLLISLIVSAGLMSVAHAGDAEAGKAKSATCAACHGADGNSLAPTFPKIAGQGERYLIKQITDIRDGNRQVPEMTPFVTGLSDEDIADLAAYFAAQAPTTGGADEKLAQLGERIYRAGVEDKGIPACLACHGPTGAGIDAAGFPHLAGQHATYTETQLNKFSMEQRANDGGRMMRDIAKRMHATEIEAVASYIQGLR